MTDSARLAARRADSVSQLTVVGASNEGICGVKQYSGILSERLGAHGEEVVTSWWDRPDGKARWRDLVAALRRCRNATARRGSSQHTQAILWHYSTFAYGVRGLPVFSPLWAWWLRRSHVPLVIILHELVYPWRRRGWRGFLFAITQRLALVPVVWASSGAIVTTPERADWLRSRWWLPRRPVTFIPVFSNVPPGVPRARRPRSSPAVIGAFGYGAPGMLPALVTMAVAILALRTEGGAELRLIGAPGRQSPAGEAWTRAAAEAGLEDVEFTGILDPAALRDALADVDALVFSDECGPTSRKTTLAACLASGRPVVAVDGPQRWDELRAASAVALSSHDSGDLAATLQRLVDDDEFRARLGAHAVAFYKARMSADVAANEILAFCRRIGVPATQK